VLRLRLLGKGCIRKVQLLYDPIMLISFVSVILSVLAVAISYMALIYTAKPRVVVELVYNHLLHAGQEHDLRFRVKMRSRIKKAAADLRIYINFVPSIEPINARYGSALELETTSEPVKVPAGTW